MGCAVDAAGPDAWVHVVFQGNRIYYHKILRMNFTSYDVQHGQDVIHIDTPQCNLMLLNPGYTDATRQSTHPYRYCKTLAVYHANVSFAGQLPTGVPVEQPTFHRLEFAWVHWYEHHEPETKFSLDRVSLCLLDFDQPSDPLGFVNPAEVLRAAHLIPRFSQGKSQEIDFNSRLITNQETWEAYYVNRWAIRTSSTVQHHTDRSLLVDLLTATCSCDTSMACPLVTTTCTTQHSPRKYPQSRPISTITQLRWRPRRSGR